jgi:hypothetical protein
MTQEILPAQARLAAARQLPPRDRIAVLPDIRLKFPQWEAIFAAMQLCHEESRASREPEGMLLVGATGAGKSTLVDSYVQQFPRIVVDHHLQQRVLTLLVYPPVTEKTLAVKMLAALGDPRFSSGTQGDMTQRIVNLFFRCQVEMLILDEIHHFVDKQSNKLLYRVSDWLKTLLKETRVACVLVGLPYASQLVMSNEQFARLFGGPWVLPTFSWEKPDLTSQSSTPPSEFETLMHQLELALPFNESSGLDEPALAWRCYVASDGVMSNLMKLIRRASTLALSAGQEHLDLPVLATAYTQSLCMIRWGIANPFSDEKKLPDYQKAVTPDPGIVGAVSGRGQRHQPPQQRMKDVM